MDKEVVIISVCIIGYIVILGGTSAFLARNKGKSLVLTFMLGIYLGPIGWLIAWLMKPSQQPEKKIKSAVGKGNLH